MTTPTNPGTLDAALDFEALVREHQAMVFRTLGRLLGRADGLDDLAQDVFLRLYRALPGFRGQAQLSTYLYRIVLNVAQDAGRRRARDARRTVSLSAPVGREDEGGLTLESMLADARPGADAQMQQDEFARVVDDELQRLSLAERSILVLFHQEDQTYEQIACTLAIPVNTVRTHLHRGRAKLRKALVEGEEDASKRKMGRAGNKGIQYAL